MNIFRDYAAAKKAFPRCLAGTSCGDFVGIETQARRDAEPPLAILRDLVRTELDLIAEGEDAAEDYSPREVKAIRSFLARCGG